MSLDLQYVFAPTPVTKRGSPVVIGGDAKSMNLVYITNTAVVIRNIENLRSADLYYEHPCQPTIAKYSPSGYYIASGDVQGNIRIWDTTQKEHPLKFELKALSGPIFDLAWNNESNRIIAVGDGKERFGNVFVWDAGNTVGEISGHTKCLLTCDFKPTRPFKIVTGGEDSMVGWFAGPPFKYVKANKDNSRFVNCVKFSPDGSKIAAVSSDKQVIVYESTDCNKVKGAEVHKLGVYGVAWSADSSKFATASADKTVIVWDANTVAPINTVQFGNNLDDQQLGCYWLGQYLLSINLAGDVSMLDPSANHPTKVLLGHNKYVCALTYHDNYLYSASYDGRIIRWNYTNGETAAFVGKGHGNQVNQLKLLTKGADTSLISCAMDDSILVTPLSTRAFPAPIAVGAPCTGVAPAGDAIIVTTVKAVVVVRNNAVVSTLAVTWTPSGVSVHPGSGEIAVAGKDDNKIHLYNLAGDALKEINTLAVSGQVTVVSYSPDGKWLATADTSRNIIIWDNASKKRAIEGWVFHSAKVTCLSWSSDSQYIVSGGLDSSLYVWSMQKPSDRLYVKTAHFGGVLAVCWINEGVVASSGMDCSIKTWTVKH